MQKRHSIFGSAVLFVCAVVWGLAFAFQRRAAGYINPVAFNGVRFALATGVILILLLICIPINKKRGKKITGWNKSTVFGGICCGLSLLLASNLQQYGIQFTTAGRASFITALYIVLVPVLGLLIGKRIGVFGRFAIPVAIAGFWLMCSSGNEALNIGDLLSLVSTVMFAVQILFIDIFGRESDPIKLTFVQFLTCAVLSVPIMAITDRKSTRLNSSHGTYQYTVRGSVLCGNRLHLADDRAEIHRAVRRLAYYELGIRRGTYRRGDNFGGAAFQYGACGVYVCVYRGYTRSVFLSSQVFEIRQKLVCAYREYETVVLRRYSFGLGVRSLSFINFCLPAKIDIVICPIV